MTVSANSLTQCPNCGAVLGGVFCSQCGQKSVRLNPSFHEFLHDLLHELLHVDGRIVQSVRLLLSKPGYLSLEHFEGRRARYVSPIRLYLIFSILYFAISAVAPVSGLYVSCTTCAPEQLEFIEGQVRQAINVWAPRTMFVIVPVFAALIALATRRSGRNYLQHLYFAFHVQAAWFLGATLAATTGFVAIPYVRKGASLVLVTYAALYFILALRRTYQLAWWSALWRATAIGAAYLIVMIATLFVIILPVIAGGDPEG